jgi:hypothetical protein
MLAVSSRVDDPEIGREHRRDCTPTNRGCKEAGGAVIRNAPFFVE